MKKKIFAVALAAVMTVTSAMSAFADTADVDITGGLGSANTGDEALGAGDFDVTYTFHNASHDTSANWFNFAVELFDADGNFITMRADAFGVGAGTGAYNDALGTWGQDQLTTWTGQPEDWAVWAADMADADVTVNVKRAGNVLTFTYDMKAGSNTYQFVGVTPEIPNLADELSIHLGGEKVNLTNVKFTNGAAAGGNDTPAAGGNDTPAAGGNTGAGTDAPAGNGNAGGATTGDVAPYAVAVLAVAAAAVVVVLQKKKVTE